MLTVLEAAELLRRFDHVLILTHVRPDGDTVGCAAALCAALRALGKTPLIAAQMRLGEGTGAVAAMPLLDMALAVYRGTTFDVYGIPAYVPQEGAQ